MTESQRRFQPARPAEGADQTRAGGRGGANGASGNEILPGSHGDDRTIVGGRYVIEARIGEGAHAITYRAHDTRLKRTVALKVLRSHLSSDAELVSRFIREAELAASINHPNVVDVYDVGTDGNVSYIVMRLVPGKDLRHVIQDDGRLPVSRASPLVQQILRGFGAIHAAGIVHRDVKPQNILITPDGTAQVTDFGVAYAALAEGLTTQGMTVGTASYMAPEQARGEPVTQATDIYAVGVVFYEMLTGRVPFTGENPMAVMMAHLQSPPVPPSQAVPGLRIPPRVEQIILRSMAKQPGQRFPSAAAMADALSGRAAPGRNDQATTVVGAAAAPYLDDPTVARPAVAGYGPPTVARPAVPPWLAGQGGGNAPPPVIAPPSSSGGRGRGGSVALVTLLVALLAVGAVAAATQFGPFDRGGGSTRTPAALAAGSAGSSVPLVSPTQTAEPTATVSATATITPPAPTGTSEPTATQAPQATATETVEPTPTQTPSPTATFTAVPTATATSPPAATSTTEPTATVAVSTVTPAIVQITSTPARGRGGQGNGNNGNGNSGNGNGNGGNDGQDNSGGGDEAGGAVLLSASGDGVTSITVAPSDWAGAYTNLNTSMYGRDCVALYGQGSGYESASLTFELDGVPTNGVTLTLTGLDDEYDAGNPFTFFVNGQQGQGTVPQFQQWNGQASPAFGTLNVSFPADPFVDGQNVITIVNDAPGGFPPSRDQYPPYLLLGDGTLAIA